MATKPTFIPSRSIVEKSLRLSSANESSLQMLDDAMLETNIFFFDRLGSARVAEILTFGHVDNPTTNAERTRARAESVERNSIRLILMRKMPTFFLAGTSQAQQSWNEDGILRDRDRGLTEEVTRLESEVAEGISFLAGNPDADEPHVSVIGPAITNPAPGSSIWPT